MIVPLSDGSRTASMKKMSALQAFNVGKAYGAAGQPRVEALRSVSLDIPGGEFVSILGPSGCGKSTFLNIIAGFDRQTDGQVLVHGKTVTGPSAERGVVFQDSSALFPWYTVRGNVEFGLRSRGVSKPERDRLVDEALTLVRLADFADALPRQLSGGMRQLCAIARVLVMQASILLMDEPFGALDAITRTQMQQRLEDIWQRTGVTVLFVTHSVDEAIFLGDRVVVMSGRPGSIRANIPVSLARPRDVTSPEFNAIKAQAVALLKQPVDMVADGDAISLGMNSG